MRSRSGLAIRDWGGDGDPPLLLLHGARGKKEDLDAIATPLARAFHVVGYDAGGHGESPVPSAVTHDSQFDEVAEVLDAADLREPVLVGHSMGGSVAIAYAAERGGVRGVVSIDEANVPWPPKTPDPEAVVRKYTARGVDAKRAEHFARLAVLGDSISENDTARWYARIRCPVLLLMATRGLSAAYRGYVDALPRRFAMVRVEWLEGGHGLHIGRADDVAARVRDFALTVAGP